MDRMSQRARITRLLAFVVAFTAPLVVTTPAMAGCGFLNVSPCPRPPVSDPAARTPGMPVPQVKQLDRAAYGFGKNVIRGTVPQTKVLGVPDPGTVPVVGDVGAKADDGSYVMYESRVDDRTIDLMVWSTGLLGPAPVRIQLPPSWGTDPARRYPMLLLLHGGTDPADYQCWSIYSQFAAHLSDLDALVVMPSAGVGGHTTDYWNFGFQSGKQYQTFVSTELMQILKRGYKLGDKAAVAGASAGGRSALEVAWKNPGKFSAAAAYSGLLDTQIIGIDQTFTVGPLASLQQPYEMWGDPLLKRSLWNDRNPVKNLDKLRGTKLYASVGNGNQGELDAAPIWDPVEAVASTSTRSFVSAARRSGLNLTADLYGGGIHRWPYFDAVLSRSLPLLVESIGLQAQVQPPPIRP
jgi:S-formylglutathione hydrolase FrmB